MRKIFYAAILILFCAIDAHAQGGAFGDTVFGPNIAIKPGASVWICSHPSTVASCPANRITLYSDVNLMTPITNPLTTDGNGHWLAYAGPGTYDYIVTGTGITPMTSPFTFSIGGPGGGSGTVTSVSCVSGCTVTNPTTTPAITVTGVSGCVVPGNDTGIVTEHPIGTCLDSPYFTWDSSTYNLLEGTSNTLTGTVNHTVAIGSTNPLSGGTGSIVTSSVLGHNNAISAGSSAIADLSVEGQDNAVTGAVSATEVNGNNNSVTGTDAAVSNSSLNGSTLALDTNSGGTAIGVTMAGTGNTVSSGADGTNNVTVAGTGNAITADVDSGNQYTDVFGSGNSLTGPMYTSGVYGQYNVIGGCHECYAFGEFQSISANSTLDMGLSSTAKLEITPTKIGLGLSSNPELQITSGLVTLNSPQAVIVANASSTGTTLNKLAKFTGAPSTAVITSTSDVSGAIGIVSLGAGTTGSASISKLGITLCVFDGATTAGDYVNISSSTAGDCHDAGVGQPLYSIGRVMSTNGGGGTYPVDLIIGAGTGGAIATQGKVALTGQTASLSPTALITTPASPALAAYRVTAALSCDSSSASATVTFTLAWTDPSSTSQSVTSSAATCTTLGSASYQSLAYAINVKEGTAINYSTTIANTPTYSLHVLLEGAW